MQTYKQLSFASLCLVVLTGCALFGSQKSKTMVRIHEQTNPALPEGHVMTAEIPQTGRKIPVDPYPVLSENDVASANLSRTTGVPAIVLHFTPHGTMVLYESTARHRDEYLVTFLNGHPVAAWYVAQSITNGEFRVEGDFSDEEARKTVESLNKMGKNRR